jgi:hypothetical protein
VSQQDMLATLVGFSLLVIQGWRQLDAGVTPEEEEDYLYLWNQYGIIMGIKPEYLPTDVADAQAFFDAYEAREAVPAADNPQGVALARANLAMLQRLLHPLEDGSVDQAPAAVSDGDLRDDIPIAYMNHLMGAERCARLGLPTLEGHDLLRRLLSRVPPDFLGSLPVVGDVVQKGHEVLCRAIVGRLITYNYGGHPSYWVPINLDDLRALTTTCQDVDPHA